MTGRRPTLLGEPYGADMQMFVNVGATPCVIFGPGDVRVAHSADEHVPIAEVEDCARVLAAWVRRELIARAEPGLIAVSRSRPAPTARRRVIISHTGTATSAAPSSPRAVNPAAATTTPSRGSRPPPNSR